MVMTNVNNFYGAGCYDIKVKDSSANIYDLYGAISIEGDPEKEDVEIKGDDTILGSFCFSQKETLTIKANAVSFDVLEAITGNDVTSDSDSASVGLGTDEEKSPPFVEIYAINEAKSADGTECYFKKTWHKVQITKVKVTQEGESEFAVEMEGIGYVTSVDIVGGALTTARVATLEAYAK